MKHLKLYENFANKMYWIQRVLHDYNGKNEHVINTSYLGKDGKWLKNNKSNDDLATFTKAEAAEKITSFPKLRDVPSGHPAIKPYVQGYYPIETN